MKKRYDIYKREDEHEAQRWVISVWAPSRKAALDKVARAMGVTRVTLRARYVCNRTEEGRAEV